jgi:hypothetical protein
MHNFYPHSVSLDEVSLLLFAQNSRKGLVNEDESLGGLCVKRMVTELILETSKAVLYKTF